MANSEQNRKNEAPAWLRILLKIWAALFGTVKVLIGAAATVLLIVLVCCFAMAGSLADYLETDILPNAGLVLENYEMDSPSYIYFVNEDGEIEELQKIHSSTDWINADYEDIPQALIDAAVAIEDKRFYEHQGVDWFTTVKAFANMFFGDKTVGGSSITQQLIKNRTENDSVTVQRKVQEFFQATVVEKNYDKQTVMEMYLNSIYLGQGCRGVRSAAKTYFGKELQMLTIAECASLIGITNNPSLFDPYSTSVFTYKGEQMDGMQRNRYRQLTILGEMLAQGFITQQEYDEAVAQEIVLKNGIDAKDKWTECANENCDYEGIASTYGGTASKLKCPKCGQTTEVDESNSQIVYSYFVDTVLRDLALTLAQRDGYKELTKTLWENYYELIGRSGYHIYSTLDMGVQNQVDKIYQNLENIPDTRSAQQLQSAIVIVDNTTGDVVAMAGGVGTEKEHFGFNRATQAKLQSGSSIKPLTVYAPGFQKGTISPASVIKDLPVQYTSGPWPKNDNRSYSYTRTILSAVTSSVNAVAANTVKLTGDDYAFEFAKEDFGLSTLRDPDDRVLASLSLGAHHTGVTVRDMTSAFATFANKGVYREGRTYTKVYDSKGNLVVDNTQDARTILSEKAVTYMNYCLVNAANHGTGTSAVFSGMQIAGKTGTTSNSKDRWFCGFTGHYTAAVWTGYDTPEKINLSYNPAARLWKKVMQPIHKGLKSISLYSTKKMSSVTVCLDSGLLATSACKNDVRGSRTATAMCYPEDRPKKSCNVHTEMLYCEDGKGVSNEYCLKFAAIGAAKVETKSLVKLKKDDFDDLKKAMKYGLKDDYCTDEYVYLVTDKGADAAFTGFSGKLAGNTLPYKVCTKHTLQAWTQHQIGGGGSTTTPETPDTPETPETPAD